MKKILLIALLLLPIPGWCATEAQAVLQVRKIDYLPPEGPNLSARYIRVTGVIESITCTYSTAACPTEKQVLTAISSCWTHGHQSTGTNTGGLVFPSCEEIFKAKKLYFSGPIPDGSTEIQAMFTAIK